MTIWTAHLQPDREPILLREGFSWGAMLFGPVWLLAHRAWVPAALSFATYVMVRALMPSLVSSVMIPAIMLLHGLSGNDMLAWALERRGYLFANVVTARSEAEALARLLTNRPDLMATFRPSSVAR